MPDTHTVTVSDGETVGTLAPTNFEGGIVSQLIIAAPALAAATYTALITDANGEILFQSDGSHPESDTTVITISSPDFRRMIPGDILQITVSGAVSGDKNFTIAVR